MGALVFGLQIALIGIGMVFVALIALILIISLQEKVLSGFTKKKPEVEAPKVEAAPVVRTSQPEIKKEDQDELIAVIAAAISAYNGQQVVVKNIRRVTGNSGLPWANAGRTDNMNLRQMV
ncbi:MAG TPA: hypothetical protein GXZ50_08425 [Clostridia bacterium]|nr:hypothetical protein [Clostridia bacterium]